MCQFLFIFFNVHHKKNDNAISRVRAKRERNILLVHLQENGSSLSLEEKTIIHKMKLVYLKTFFTQIHFTLIQAQCYTLILS